MLYHDFDTKLKEGLKGEHLLDAYFSEWFDICPVSRAQQRAGIDRIYKDRRTGQTWSVEYKMDNRASQTGNAFVETVSVRRPGQADIPGWAYSSQADQLMYYVSTDELVYIFLPSILRRTLPTWEQEYQTRDVQNRDYVTVGLLIPLAEFETHALCVVSL